MTKASATSEGRISGWQKHLQCPGSSKVFKKKKSKILSVDRLSSLGLGDGVSRGRI